MLDLHHRFHMHLCMFAAKAQKCPRNAHNGDILIIITTINGKKEFFSIMLGPKLAPDAISKPVSAFFWPQKAPDCPISDHPLTLTCVVGALCEELASTT